MPDYDHEPDQVRRHRVRGEEQLRVDVEQTRESLKFILEMDDRELTKWRDDTKAIARERRQREERRQMSVMEILKWAIGAAGGAALTWLTVNHGGGGK